MYGSRPGAPASRSAARGPTPRARGALQGYRSRHPCAPTNSPPATCGAGPGFIMDRLVRMAVRCTGEQMIVVLDGTREAPACAWSLTSSRRWPAGQAAAVAPGVSVRTWLIRDYHDAPSDGFLDAVEVLRVRHPVRIYSG